MPGIGDIGPTTYHVLLFPVLCLLRKNSALNTLFDIRVLSRDTFLTEELISELILDNLRITGGPTFYHTIHYPLIPNTR